MTGKIQQIRDLTVTFAVLVGLALFGYRQVYPHDASPAAGIDVGKLAKAYAPEVLDTLGDAWNAAAAKIETPGSKVTEAQKALHDTWDALRGPAFDRTVTPAFSTVLAPGTEPTDVQRPMLGKLYRDFGTALKKASGK